MEVATTTVKRKKQLRREMTVTEKVALLNRYKGLPQVSQRKAAKILGVTRGCLQNVIKNESVIRAQNKGFGEVKRLRAGKDAMVEKSLLEWYKLFAVVNDEVPSTKAIIEKAYEIAHDLGNENFKANSGWLGRWKKRSGLKITDRATTLAKFENNRKIANIPSLFPDFSDENVYVADETAIFLQALPNSKYVEEARHVNQEGFLTATDRFTLLLTCNMNGDKEELLMIGNSKRPIQSSPIPCKYSSNALMTSAIFEEWITSWDLRLQQDNNRKIALLLDDCLVHQCNVSVKNITIIYLPPDKPSVLMLCDFGISRSFKAHFRYALFNKLVAVVSDSSPADDVGITAQQVDILEAIQLVKEAWSNLSKATIQNCWRGAKFSLLPPTFDGKLPTPDDLILDTWERWLAIDTGVDVVDNSDSDNNDDNETQLQDEPPSVSPLEMFECLCRLQTGLAETDFKHFDMFDEVKEKIKDHMRNLPPSHQAAEPPDELNKFLELQ